MYTKYSPPRPQITFISLYDQPFSRYRFFENRKFTEWPQNDLKHLSVKSTLCTLNTHPRGPNITPFRSTTSCFWHIRLSITGNAPNDPRITLITEVSKVPCVHWILTTEAKISLRFALRSLVFQIIEVFGFPIGYIGEIKQCIKNQKLKISKNPNQHFCENHWEEISGKGWNDSIVIWGRSSVLKFVVP